MTEATRREQFWKHAKEANPKIKWDQMTSFMNGLDAALVHLIQLKKNRSTYRNTHEALRDIYIAMAAKTPNVARIRKKLKFLPQEAIDALLRRARQRYRLFKKRPSLGRLALIQWLDSLNDERLLVIGRSLVATGLVWSFGQKRKNGHFSAPHLEPYILGYARRINRPDLGIVVDQPYPKGGRPSQIAIDDFMTSLGLLWLELTGLPPESTRGKKSAFVKIAMLALKEAGVVARETTIRRFFSAIRHHKNRISQVPWLT